MSLEQLADDIQGILNEVFTLSSVTHLCRRLAEVENTFGNLRGKLAEHSILGNLIEANLEVRVLLCGVAGEEIILHQPTVIFRRFRLHPLDKDVSRFQMDKVKTAAHERIETEGCGASLENVLQQLGPVFLLLFLVGEGDRFPRTTRYTRVHSRHI